MITKTNRMPVITLTLTSLLGFGAAIGAANSAQAAEAAGIKVSYADLNLARGADVQTLYRRIEHAAANACTPVDQRELARHLAYVRCYDAAIEAAVAEVRSPELLAVDKAARAARVS
jgi:UrcA family protein